MIHLHRHDQFSLFDGLGKAKDAAQYVASMGQKALALTNHGNVSGLIQHYFACKEAGIIPILGVEGYLVPKAEKSKEVKSNHVVLLAKNDIGYKNMMNMISEANSEENFYYKPRITFKMLKKYREGLIMSSACLAGIISRAIMAKDFDGALRLAQYFKDIFDEDFYLEVMPHGFEGQNLVNEQIVKIGNKLNIKVIMTSDAHLITKQDFEAYKTFAKVKDEGREGRDVKGYKHLYLMNEDQMIALWNKNNNIPGSKYIYNTVEVASKCKVELNFGSLVPKMYDDGKAMLKKLAHAGLERREKNTTEYVERLNHEINVVYSLEVEDYFILVSEIVRNAHRMGVKTGFGRGSVGNSLLAYTLGLTEVDPIYFGGMMFERFMRPDKKKLPDIDLDFDSQGRDKVIKWIGNKFKDSSAPIISYGQYRVKNLVNDLVKIFNVDDGDKEAIVQELESEVQDGKIQRDLMSNKKLYKHNQKYKGMIEHFSKIYGQIRFFGTHASGVAIVNGKITDYVATMRNKKTISTAYDMDDLNNLNILKIDILGLNELSMVAKIEDMVKSHYKQSRFGKIFNNKKIYRQFSKSNTDGVFQFEGDGAKKLLSQVQPTNLIELTACNALNRPAPKKLGMVDAYLEAKDPFGGVNKDTYWYQFTKETYGTIIYQEQIMKICISLGMSWDDTDKIMKLIKENKEPDEKEVEKLKKIFKLQAYRKGLKKADAEEMFMAMTKYLFNQAHALAYTLTSAYSMYLKIKYPTEFMYALLSGEKDDRKRRLYEGMAVANGVLVFLPHINGTANYSIEKFNGEKVIRRGLSTIKFVGANAAIAIEKNGQYNCEDLMIDRIPKRVLNSRAVSALREAGATEFNEKRFLRRVELYNAAILREYQSRRRY